MDDCENCLYKYSCELKEIKEPEDKCDDFKELKVKCDFSTNNTFMYWMEIPIENQTFRMFFELYDRTLDTKYFNVSMVVFNKRYNVNKHENKIEITGQNPALTLAAATECFHKIEQKIIKAYNEDYNIIFVVNWLDNQRRDIYTRYLKRYGYTIGYDGEKCLRKKVKKGSVIND